MKPKLNLNSPIVKQIIEKHNEICRDALNTEPLVEKAVIPIYHLAIGKRIKQIGSGVLLRIKDEFFILSATHVFGIIGENAILTGDGEGTTIQELVGERFYASTGKNSIGDYDPVDTSVFHILSELSESLKKRAITMEDIDIYDGTSGDIFLSAGFRIKRSSAERGGIYSKQEAFPSFEISEADYEVLNLNSQIHIVLWHEEQYLLNNTWQLSPIPRGFSGGAIIKISEIETANGREKKQVLVGIVTEHRKKSRNIEGVLIGTRIKVHLAALKHFMPHLFEE